MSGACSLLGIEAMQIMKEGGVITPSFSFVDDVLDAVGVGAPVGDALFDGFGLEVLGEGSVNQCREFGVGGEAEGD